MFQADVIVIGAGLIGLSCATALARDHARVFVISSNEPGSASAASAGVLAPSAGQASLAARATAITSRDMYPAYLESLASRTGVRVPLDRSGVIDVAFSEEEARSLRAHAGAKAQWIDDHELRAIEPTLAPAVGALFYPEDGAVDTRMLLTAVRLDAELDDRISMRDGRVTGLELESARMGVLVESAGRVEGPAVILAAGAWVGLIGGLPRPLPVAPVRGQMLAVAGGCVGHVVMSSRAYLVRRGDRTLVGSTMEHVGFDARTTADAAAMLRTHARDICPDLSACPVVEHWAGLRPVTPDLLPIVGRDPEYDGLFYACGHSRNGVLLAPVTATAIAELVASSSSSVDLAAYAPDRFKAASSLGPETEPP